VPDVTAVSPDGYSLDNFYLVRPGADEVQLDLFADYQSNVAMYPTFQEYFRKHKPRFLAAWGKRADRPSLREVKGEHGSLLHNLRVARLGSLAWRTRNWLRVWFFSSAIIS
jgi:hypothetical protein